MTQKQSHSGFRQLALGLAIAGASVAVSADAVLNPNQITGEIQFTNANPKILSIPPVAGQPPMS